MIHITCHSLRKTSIQIPLIALLLWTATSLAEESPAPKKSPENFIELLRSGDFDDRKDGEAELMKLGAGANDAIQNALRTCKDLELQNALERILIQLKRSFLKIEVVDTKGNPIPNAEGRITARPLSHLAKSMTRGITNYKTLRTDAQGFIYIKGFWPGSRLRFNAQWPNHIPHPTTVKENIIYLTAGENRLRYVLTHGLSIPILVVKKTDGTPIANAEVTLEKISTLSESPTHVHSKASTDAHGIARIQNLTESQYIAHAKHSDYLVGASKPISVTASKTTASHKPRIQLRTREHGTGSIRFSILDEMGEVWPDQEFFVFIKPHPRNPAEATAHLKALKGAKITPVDPDRKVMRTNKKGHLLIPSLVPRNYWIYLIPKLKKKSFIAPCCFPRLTVVAGKSTEVPRLDWPRGGAISGNTQQVALPRNAGFNLFLACQDAPETQLFLKDPAGLASWPLKGIWMQASGYLGSMHSLHSGTFQMLPLAPGPYVLAVIKNSRPIKVFTDIKVEDKRTTRLPYLDVDHHHSKKIKKTDILITGKIQQADGTPLRYALIRGFLSSQRMLWGVVKNGSFQLRFPAVDGHPLLITIWKGRALLYSKRLHKGESLTNMTFRLKNPRLGRARIQISDEKGQPLAGVIAAVKPPFNFIAQIQNSRTKATKSEPTFQSKATRANGEVVFSKIKPGRNRFEFSLEGYYPASSPALFVQPDREVVWKVQLKKGRTLTGKVLCPHGVRKRDVLIYLFRSDWRGTQTRTTALKPDGSFKISGIRPGSITLVAQYPGLIVKRPARILISRSGKLTSPTLELIKARRLDVLFNKDLADAKVSIYESQQWHPAWRDTNPSSQRIQNQTFLNQEGQGQATFMRPGSYDLLISPTRNSANKPEARNTAPASRLIKDISISSTKNITLDWRRKTFTPASGQVSGRFLFDPDSIPIASLGIRLHLFLVSSDAVATLTLHSSQNQHQQIVVRPITTPDQTKFTVHEPNRFTFTHLPAGQYSLYAQTTAGGPYSSSNGRVLGRAQKVRTFTLGEYETLSIGEVPFKHSLSIQNLIEKKFEEQYGPATSE